MEIKIEKQRIYFSQTKDKINFSYLFLWKLLWSRVFIQYTNTWNTKQSTDRKEADKKKEEKHMKQSHGTIR